MKKKTILLLYTAAFTLCACTNNGTGQNDDAVQDATSAEEFNNTGSADASQEASNDGSDMALDESTAAATDDSSFDTGFKKAYIEIIEEEQEKRASVSENSTSEEFAE